jgi:hypothetical protein
MSRPEIEQGITSMQERSQAMAHLRKAGLFVPSKPLEAVQGISLDDEWENMKRRYGGISNIPYNELGDYLDRWTAMLSYARFCEAVADIDKTTSIEIRDTVKKQLYLCQEGSRELRDAGVYTEPLYIDWENRVIENTAKYSLARMVRENYESRVSAISREITRRGNDFASTRLNNNRGNNM